MGDSPKLASVTTLVIGKALRMLAEKAEFMALAGMTHRRYFLPDFLFTGLKILKFCAHQSL